MFGFPGDEDSDDELTTQLRRARGRERRSSSERVTKGLKPHSTFTVDGLDIDDDYFCCPSYIESFALKGKDWGWVRVDGLKKIEWKESQFDNLQMDLSTKHLIKVLASQVGTSLRAHDEIDRKGTGLVVLLHGNPGLGKTLTAGRIPRILDQAFGVASFLT
jgi:hypothetical protein